jgi:hypothetical protein
MAIRKVNAITRPGCAEAQDGQLSASGIRASAAPEGEHKGVRQRNTFGAERRFSASPVGCDGASGTGTYHPLLRQGDSLGQAGS